MTVICSWKKREPRVHKIGNIIIKRVGKNHEYSNKGSFSSRLSFAFSAYKQLKKEKNVNVVDCYNFTSYIPGYFGAKKIKAKKIATYHETWIGEWIKNKGLVTGLIGEILERITLSLKWDLIIPVSNFTKKRLENKGIKPSKLKVVYNGVFLDEFKQGFVKKNKDFTLICVSRLVKTKRQEVIFKALKELKDKKIKLILVGTGDDSKYYEKRVKELKLEKQVVFTGFLKTKI